MQSNTQLETSKKPLKVLVLGGNGFIGRYTVAALKQKGVKAVIGTRQVNNSEIDRQVKLHKSLSEQAWQLTLDGIDAVINTVGILRERKGESYDQVHHLAVGALSRACENRNIPFIHMSALGIDPIEKEFAKSKLRGEAAILKSGCQGAIVRASIVNAVDGYGSGWMYRVARWPVWMLPGRATKLLCPIEAKDLGEALANLVLENDKPMKIIEVGGDEFFTLKTYLRKLRAQQECLPIDPLFVVRVPSVVAKLFAKIFDVLHLTPYSVGHHELLENDNFPIENSLAQILGRAPSEIGRNPNDVIEIKPAFLNKRV